MQLVPLFLLFLGLFAAVAGLAFWVFVVRAFVRSSWSADDDFVQMVSSLES